jgi:hypothetical protein
VSIPTADEFTLNMYPTAADLKKTAALVKHRKPGETFATAPKSVPVPLEIPQTAEYAACSKSYAPGGGYRPTDWNDNDIAKMCICLEKQVLPQMTPDERSKYLSNPGGFLRSVAKASGPWRVMWPMMRCLPAK